MDKSTWTLILGVFVACLGLLGLMSGEGQLARAMNVDIFLDVLRIGFGSILAVSSLGSEDFQNTTLGVFGVIYMFMFVVGLVSPDLLGFLPHEIGWVDHLFHLGTGVLAFGLLMSPMDERPPVAA